MANKQPPATQIGELLDMICSQMGETYKPYALKSLAQDLGMSLSTLQRLRSGVTSPTLKTVRIISQKLGYTFLEVAATALNDPSILNEHIDISPKGLILGEMYDKGSDAQREFFDRLMFSFPAKNNTGEEK